VNAHNKDIEVAWNIPVGCGNKLSLTLKANELFQSGIVPLRYPDNKNSPIGNGDITNRSML